uniref:Ferric-chelate reductase 1 n=1 Tax=Elaeophora elaphi TaxID=1147741 RepID=A0A0R3RJK0_9BILA
MNATPSVIVVLFVAPFTLCSSQFNISECLKSKACIFISEHCEEKGDCKKIISYATQPDNWVVIELFFNMTEPDTTYVAVGFSEDTLMGNEGVTHCGFGEMNQAGVFLSQNDDKHNIPLNLTTEDAANYVELLEATHTSNSIYCKFRQRIAPNEAAQNAYVPHLNHTYYLLLAYGTSRKYGVMDIHSLDERSKDFPSFVSTPINLAAWEQPPQAPAKLPTNRKLKRLEMKLPGILMLIGWMWLVPSAIATARYLRQHWPDNRLFGSKIWFQIHRTANYVAIVIVVIGLLSVFTGKQWRWTGPAIGKTLQRNLSAGAFHSIIGAICVGVMLIQPVGAFFRCDEGSKSRVVFNCFHRFFGFLSFLLAQISIFLSVIFFNLWAAKWAAILLYALYLLVLALLLFLVKKINLLKGHQNTSVSYEGRHYHREQIVITKTKHDDKSNRLIVLVVLAFTVAGALIAIIMMALMLATM